MSSINSSSTKVDNLTLETSDEEVDATKVEVLFCTYATLLYACFKGTVCNMMLIQLTKVTRNYATLELNSFIGEVWEFMAKFEGKYWENCKYYKFYLKIFFVHSRLYNKYLIFWQNRGAMYQK